VNLHHETPAPTNPKWLVLPPFEEEPPVLPSPQNVRFFDRLLLRSRRIDRDNTRRQQEYQRQLDDWNARATQHLKLIDEWRHLGQQVVSGNRTAMETILGHVLSTLPWPRETNVSFDFGDDWSTLALDVDLPEIEDMPNRIATVASRGIRVNFQNRTESQIRRDYVRLVHGTAFRIAGEIFANLPKVSQVTVSEFSLRTDPQTGTEREEYVLSVMIRRSEWEAINFERLQEIDPTDALARFQLIRSLDRAGGFRRIDPLSA
jgi:hypothetical protein